MFEKMVLATDLSPDWDQIIGCAESPGWLRAPGYSSSLERASSEGYSRPTPWMALGPGLQSNRKE